MIVVDDEKAFLRDDSSLRNISIKFNMSFFEDPSTLRGDHNYNDHPDEFAFDPNATNSFNQNHMSQEDFYDENHNFEQTYNNMQEDSEPYLESYSQEQNDPNQFAFNLDSHVEAYSSPTPQKITPLNQPQQRSHQAAPPPLPLSQSRRINSIDTRESNRQPPKNRHGIELRPVSILRKSLEVVSFSNLSKS